MPSPSKDPVTRESGYEHAVKESALKNHTSATCPYIPTSAVLRKLRMLRMFYCFKEVVLKGSLHHWKKRRYAAGRFMSG